MSLTEDRIKRFWAKVAIRGKNDCWYWKPAMKGKKKKWQSSRTFSLGHCKMAAPRVCMMITLGRDLKPGEHVLHDCPNGDDPRCVNPRHLYIGTHQDNMRDVAVKGQRKGMVFLRGTKNGSAKANDETVRWIRRLKRKGMSYTQLTNWFGISRCPLHRMVHFQSWKDVV
jgi:hypothetical protein